MNRIDKVLLNTKLKAQRGLAEMSRKATGDETLIVKIMLMVIAVVLTIAFRDSVKSMITSLLENVKTNIESMYTSA